MILFLATFTFLQTLTSNAKDLSISTDTLKISINDKGEITEFIDLSKNKNYAARVLQQHQKSYLVHCKLYNQNPQSPNKMTILSEKAGKYLVELSYPSGAKLNVKIENKKTYIRMELVKADPDADIDKISWGWYRLTLDQQLGEWIGIARSKDFSIGILGLEPNTDAKISATHEGYGANLYLEAVDHRRPRPIEGRKYMTSQPIDVSVIGSAIALYGTKATRDAELDAIEKVVIAEKLPHPIFRGKWNKKSEEPKRISLWIDAVHAKEDKCIQLSKDVKAGTICKFHGYYKNWGHFEVDKRYFPGGLPQIKAFNNRLWDEAKTLNTAYTLSGFTKPMSAQEPYITPKPDSRLAKWDLKSNLITNLSENDKTIKIKFVEGLKEVIDHHSYNVICINDEMIEFPKYEIQGDVLIMKDAIRGAFKSQVKSHNTGDKVIFMYVSGYHNFYPGTVEMNNEQAGYIADDVNATNDGVFILDGHESCYETGHGQYALNTYAKVIYDKTNSKKDKLITYSITLSNYNWHMISYVSWGEYELESGFRGTCLDYRINRQIQLRNNLVPNKMGQYYPTDATNEDIEWLMARVAGWNSGVDFNLDIDRFMKNPEYKQICQSLKLWYEAKEKGVFTEKELMQLRQTDLLFHLEKVNGKFKLNFLKRWMSDRVKVLPPSAFKISSNDPEMLKPATIDWTWTHNPGLYRECGISDDLLYSSNKKNVEFTVTPPAKSDNRDWRYNHLLPVIRVPKDAKTPVTNIVVTMKDKNLIFPKDLVLNPGEYLSIPHDTNWGAVYDETTHKVKREFYIPQFNPYWRFPELVRGEQTKIKMSAKPVKDGKEVKMILNLRFWKKDLPN
jgi:hypothetical protein